MEDCPTMILFSCGAKLQAYRVYYRLIPVVVVVVVVVDREGDISHFSSNATCFQK